MTTGPHVDYLLLAAISLYCLFTAVVRRGYLLRVLIIFSASFSAGSFDSMFRRFSFGMPEVGEYPIKQE